MQTNPHKSSTLVLEVKDKSSPCSGAYRHNTYGNAELHLPTGDRAVTEELLAQRSHHDTSISVIINMNGGLIAIKTTQPSPMLST
jgi:hypothetical protein